jgi:hypothetical protein
MAASRAGAVLPLRPFAGIDSARSLLFSDDVLTYVSFRRSTASFEQIRWTECIGSATSLLYPHLGGPRQPLDRQL